MNGFKELLEKQATAKESRISSPCDAALNSLADNLSKITAMLNDLETRLSPILADKNKKVEKETQFCFEPSSHIVNTVQTQNQRLVEIQQQLADLFGRLTV